MYYEYHDDHPRRKEMIVRAALYFNLITEAELDEADREQVCNACTTEHERRYHHLPFDIKRLYLYYSYQELVRPLVRFDRIRKEMSYQKIAYRYSIPRSTVRYMIKGK